MTGIQYKSIMNWTLKHHKTVQGEKQSDIIREIFKNCGVSFPHGNNVEIRKALTECYMGWKECTSSNAQESANAGDSAIGVSADRIVVIKPKTDDLTESVTVNSTGAEGSSIPTVAFAISDLSTDEIAQMSFFTYSAASNKCSTLDRLKYKFPSGTYWNHVGLDYNNPEGYTYSPCPSHSTVSTCNCYSDAWQCVGFAYKCGYDATGKNPKKDASWQRIDNPANLNGLKGGDVVIYSTDVGQHAIYVTHVNGDVVTCGDCNGNGNNHLCQISWGKTKSKSYIAGRCILWRISPIELDI